MVLLETFAGRLIVLAIKPILSPTFPEESGIFFAGTRINQHLLWTAKQEAHFMSNITLLLGGARSGKSSYAVDLAGKCDGHVVYLATGISCDEEMERRIETHKNDRPDSWETIEEPLYVENALKRVSESADFVLLDCLGFWVSNLLLHYQSQGKEQSQIEDMVLKHILNVISIAEEIELEMVIVSNEVGMGIVPEGPLGRLFRDILGRANQTVAARAHKALFFVAGLPMTLK